MAIKFFQIRQHVEPPTLFRSSSVAVFDISIETDPLRITTSGLKGLADELV